MRINTEPPRNLAIIEIWIISICALFSIFIPLVPAFAGFIYLLARRKALKSTHPLRKGYHIAVAICLAMMAFSLYALLAPMRSPSW